MNTETLPFKFHGNAKEYFGIWIVNLALSIVTLGIYSAWAKVRNNKYFYQNTEIGGRRFDYHATGKQILIGRLIIVGLFVLIQVLSLVPVILFIVLAGLFIAFPWLIVRSLRFNARVSSWSNVRFDFDGAKMPAFLVYLVYPFLTVFTLYLAFPFADRARRRYVINNHLLGKSRLSFDSAIGPFYVAFLAGVIAAIILLTVTLAGTLGTFLAIPSNPSLLDDSIPIIFRAYIGMIVALVIGGIIYNALIRNVLFNGTTLEGGHSLHSNISVGAYMWISLTNALAIICTLGLMLPWARVRMAHYLAEHTQMTVAGDLDGFVGDIQPEGGAFGDAYTDLEAIDVGLPL